MDNLPKIKSKATLFTVRLDQIVPNPFQPRKAFDEEELLELANDIAENGLMQPPLVRLSPDDWFLDEASRLEPGTKNKQHGFYVLNRAWIRFWPNTPRVRRGKEIGELLGEYVQPTPSEVASGATVGTIYLSTATVNALTRIIQNRAKPGDVEDGLITVLHEANHSVGKCRLFAPMSQEESDIEEDWAQRQAEVLLPQWEASLK